MTFTDLFIKRPILAISLNLLILLGGYMAWSKISVRQYPRSDVSVVTITTAYVGANADLVRGFITTPLERSIASADGIDYMESASAQGLSTITAHLRLNFDVNDALTQVQAKVAQVRSELPPEAEAPVINVESSDNKFAIMYLSFFSKEQDQNQITDYLTRVVQPQIAAVSGVQKAEILGARVFAMRVWLKPDRLAAYGLSPNDVSRSLAGNNFLAAVGESKGGLISVNLTANTDLRSKEEFENLVVKQSEGALVRLRDIADVQLGAENYTQDVRFSGQKATFMGVWVLPNANAIEVIQRVRAIIPDIERSLPSGMKVDIAYDATNYINSAIHSVVKTLIETVCIVIVVIYLFIGSIRSVLVPVVAIPLSLIGALGLIYLFGFTLNLLTLLAIVLAVGIVVDDAIVMLENVERHVSDGMKPIPAALRSGRELFGPTVAMTITLAAVYAPIGFQGGLTGTLFKEFAFTLAGAVLISGLVALTLSPVMAAHLVHHEKQDPNKLTYLDRLLLTVFRTSTPMESFRNWYVKVLRGLLRVSPGVLVFALMVMALLPVFFSYSKKELAPREDQGVVFGILQAAPNTTMEETAKYAAATNQIFEAQPEFRQSFQLITPTGGFSGMLLKPWDERRRDSETISGMLWGPMSAIPGIRMILTTPPPLPGGSDFPIEFVISSTDSPERIASYAGQLVGKAFKSVSFTFADSDLKFDLPQSEIVVDRDRVASMGLNLSSVALDLNAALGGNYLNRFNIQGRSYKVIPQVERAGRLTPDQLLDIHIQGPSGKLVTASTVAHIENTVQARQLNRFQQLNSAKIQGALREGVSIDQGLKVLETEAKSLLPSNYVIDYAGESRQLRKEQSTFAMMLLVAIVIIFLVLASQFDSFRDPLIILVGSVPLALAGALAFVFMHYTTLNTYSQVGLVTLVGLISKNGILIVEFANHMRESGLDKLEAIIQAVSVRLRPVLMTSVATVVGHMPLIFAHGAGAGARNSIGYVLVTGMIVGTFFTLFVLPAIYVALAGEHKKKVDRDEDLVDGELHYIEGNGRPNGGAENGTTVATV